MQDSMALVKNKAKKKLLATALPAAFPIIFIFVIMFTMVSGGGNAIDPPASEKKTSEYQQLGAELGIPWDIIMLVDAERAQSGDIEDYNPLETALEFAVLQEQKFTVSEEKTKKDGKDVIVQHNTLEEKVNYVGKSAILNYIGIMDLKDINASKLIADAKSVAEKKSSDSVSYKVTFSVTDDIEGIMSSVFGFSKQQIQDIMELHNNQYLASLYNGGTPVINIGNIQIGQLADVEDAVYQFLKNPEPNGCGFNEIGIAAAMGNIAVESSFNTAANNSNNYFGLCQWGGGRWSGNPISLVSFSQLAGTEWTDLQTQLNFFALECSSTYPGVYEQMKVATDLTYATDYFCTKFEVCTGAGGNYAISVVDGQPYQDLATRRAKAQLYYSKYANANSDD